LRALAAASAARSGKRKQLLEKSFDEVLTDREKPLEFASLAAASAARKGRKVSGSKRDFRNVDKEMKASIIRLPRSGFRSETRRKVSTSK
jgi:hypothetical protein